MTPRSIRRAAERRARKLAFKAARRAEASHAATAPVEPLDFPAPDFVEPLHSSDSHTQLTDGGADHRFLSSATAISPAQLAANRTNAQHSTGPKTSAGKGISSLNNFRHGFAGQFKVLASENQSQFDQLLADLLDEHQPATPTERLLVEKMAQHFWLSRRALAFQDAALESSQEKQLALYLRYQTTHDRAFHKCLNDLVKLRAEKRKMRLDEAALCQRAEDLKNGFESQKRKAADEARKQEMHEARLRAINSKTDEREIDNEIRQTIEAPLPGNVRLPFDTLKDVFRIAASEVSRQLKTGHAA